MKLKMFDFARLIHRLEAAFAVTLPIGVLREGSDEIVIPDDGFPGGEVSSLSIALYQMGLCKHFSEAPPVLPAA